MEKVIVVDVEKCLACGSCRIACVLAHCDCQDLTAALSENDRLPPRIDLKTSGHEVFPLLCQHCKNAPCIKACPTGAISRHGEHGPVILDREQCRGRGACLDACPFGAIKRVSETSPPVKCDLCIHLLEKGGEPACVAACPTGALKFLAEDDISRKKQAKYMKTYGSWKRLHRQPRLETTQKEEKNV
jgi:carbon-monoxide dehydrogenase iron sulfur subunit